MDESQARKLCEALNLGTPLGAAQSVPGGFLHQMWRLSTTKGVYAVKELSDTFMHRPDSADLFEATERIAARMARAGIPAVDALETASGRVLSLGGSGDASFLIYPWIDGQTLPPSPVDPAIARIIGATLARIHTLNNATEDGQAPEGEIHILRDDEWVLLARRGAEQHQPWATPLRDLQPRLVLWNARYRRVVSDLLRTQVISHRDLDQRNVLWRDQQTPALVDWESAGAINPTVELADVALAWSGIVTGEPAPDAFRAIVAGYREAGATLRAEPRDALYGTLAHWLAWLRFCLQRSLGDGSPDPAEREIGAREAVAALAVLTRIADGIDLYASWLDGRG